MNSIKRVVFFFLLLSAALQPVHALAGTVVLHNGDILQGAVKTGEFSLRTPYGAVKAATPDIKMISRTAGNEQLFTLLTLNNDSFSGLLSPEAIEFQPDSGALQSIALDRIDKIIFTYTGSSQVIQTTLFSMKNGDQFSGKLLNDSLGLQTGQETHHFQQTNFSRLLFYETDELMASALLNNGTLIIGKLLEDRLGVNPESVSRLSLCRSEISQIQFNAEKLVLRTAPSLGDPAYDSDGDSIPDATDQCPDTACLATVDESGCASQGRDSDGDGVADSLDKCPGTGPGMPVNSFGCWVLTIPYFDFNRADIRSSDYALLEGAVNTLTTFPDMVIEIQGHTDNRGPDAYNLLLSRRRADKIMGFFLSRGIKKERLTVTGMGESQPVASNETDTGRSQNRRVMLLQVK